MRLFRSRILIQGIGCVETGAQVVLRELIKAVPRDREFDLLCTQETARLLGNVPANVRVLGLSHKIWGRWLRIPLELLLGLIGWLRIYRTIINLSHYGFCLGGDYVLYIHSPLLMDTKAGSGWKNGSPNPVKRWMLDTCLKRARLLVLQTDGMRSQLLKYSEEKGITLKKNQLIRPSILVNSGAKPLRKFGFQLFYPTSRFPHKRAELAVAAAVRAHGKDGSIGLAITIKPDGVDNQSGICWLGPIERERVYEWFAGSDALLFTSERETLGLPILEALDFGLPVIAPYLPYAIELLGDAGCYFYEDTETSVVEAIECCQAEHGHWRLKSKQRAVELQKESLSWARHWEVFLGNA